MTEPTLGELLLMLRRKIMERAQESRIPGELSASQYDVLSFVSTAGSVPMDAIAMHLGIKPPSATALIAALERKGLIARKGGVHDRRIVNVALTAAAKRKQAVTKKRKEQVFESLLTKLSARDRKEFARILIRLTEE